MEVEELRGASSAKHIYRLTERLRLSNYQIKSRTQCNADRIHKTALLGNMALTNSNKYRTLAPKFQDKRKPEVCVMRRY